MNLARRLAPLLGKTIEGDLVSETLRNLAPRLSLPDRLRSALVEAEAERSAAQRAMRIEHNLRASSSLERRRVTGDAFHILTNPLRKGWQTLGETCATLLGLI